MDDSINSRRVINYGAHQSSVLHDSYHNLNMSSSQQFDQNFDQQKVNLTYGEQQQRHSQMNQQVSYGQQIQSKSAIATYQSYQHLNRTQTEQVHDNFQIQMIGGQPQKRYDQFNRAETSANKSPAKQVTQLNTNRSEQKLLGAGLAAANSSSQNLLNPYQNSVEINKQRVDLEPILSASQKFEESVKDPGRIPQRIPGLTEFLVSQHYKRIGVFSKKEQTLFEFWKKYVSGAYRQKREEKAQSGLYGTAGAHQHLNNTQCRLCGTDSPQKGGNSFNKAGMSFKSQKSAKNGVFDEAKENTTSNMYKKYEWNYEMDVRFTIQKDLEDEHDDYKKNQLSQQFESESKYKKDIQIREQREIEMMLNEFYQDLKYYEIEQAKDKFERDKRKQEARRSMVGPEWHKRQTTETNPIESIEEEPKKPVMSSGGTQGKTEPALVTNSEFEKEKQRIEKDIDREYNFLLNLIYMVRNQDHLSNDPMELFLLYKNQNEKARMGIVWAKGDDDAQRVIFNFFKAEFFLKRVIVAFQKKNKYDSQKQISLFGFYLQLKKRERLLYMIDRKFVYRNKVTYEANNQNKSELNTSVQEIIEEFEYNQKKQNIDRSMMQQEDELAYQIRHRNKLLSQVFGKEKAKKMAQEKNLGAKPGEDSNSHINILAKPKDKWKRGKKLLELQKKFPHDMVLQKMIKEEFKENRVFKYPEEYDVYDDDLEQAFKVREAKTIKVKDLSQGKVLREKFAQMDGQALYYQKQETRDVRALQRELEQFILRSVQNYLDSKKTRLKGEKKTVRDYLSSIYWDMVKQFPKQTHLRFPHMTYGTKKDSETYKKSFPMTFKRYFFKLLKSFVRTDKGLRRLKYAPPTFIIPGGKRCTIHQFGCEEDCQWATLNKKVLLRSTILKHRQREPGGYRSRVWRRKDYIESLKNVLMTNTDLINCTFEPEAGSMNQNIQAAFEANKNLKESEYFKEPDPEAYFTKLGKNFETSHPEVYKLGILRRAKLKYKNGAFEEAMNCLSEGFNIESIRKRFDPNFMKRFMAEMLLKKKSERLSKERTEQEKQGAGSKRIFLQKDEHESQKKRPEEDFENKKLVPVLREAYDLLIIMETHKKDAEKQIKRIKKQQDTLKGKLSKYTDFKKSQTKIDLSKGEKILFKTIMCPLKDKCGKIMKPRWPTSNIKSFTQFGDQCPFAHHPMELTFPESIITKFSANIQRIKSLEKNIVSEEPKVFKPAGGLFDCIGCNQKSGKHIGGPCNLCRYKEMADNESAKFIDPKRKKSLMRSMEKRESIDIKRERSEMSKVRTELNLDANYTKKFGLLKKACVLFFYGRFNDSFDVIAKAAKIIQDQKEIEANKQKIIENRWKFKLGLDNNFELPIPIEQIDPHKVDEKFLKKLDLPGIALATLKLYIEQVSPQKSEEFSKHQYLNKCIEDFYLQVEDSIDDKQKTINKMKKQVEQLDAEADFAEAQNSPDASPEKGGDDIGGSMRIKRKKVKMCPEQLEKGYCHIVTDKHTTKVCPYAHNPIELDLIPVETKMKNLNGVIMSQTIKMKNMKPLEPWKPSKAGQIEHTHLMDMSSKRRKKSDDEDEDPEKKKEKTKKSIFERENIFRKPYEKE